MQNAQMENTGNTNFIRLEKDDVLKAGDQKQIDGEWYEIGEFYFGKKVGEFAGMFSNKFQRPVSG